MAKNVDFIALIIAIISLGWQIIDKHKTRKQARTPYLEIYKIGFPKSDPSKGKEWENRHIRYSYGEHKRSLDLDGLINVEPLEPEVANELYERRGRVFFYQINNQSCIMLDFVKDGQDIILDHKTTILTLKNTRGSIKSMAIKSADITYINGGVVHLEGDRDNLKTMNLAENEKVELILDETTSDFQNSVCELNTQAYKNAKDGMNILEMKFDSYFLKYKKIVFNIIAENNFNEETEMEISLELRREYLVPNTKII